MVLQTAGQLLAQASARAAEFGSRAEGPRATERAKEAGESDVAPPAQLEARLLMLQRRLEDKARRCASPASSAAA